MSSSLAPEGSRAARRRAPSLVFRLTALYSTAASLLVLVAVAVVYRELVVDIDREADTLLRENALLVDALLLHPLPDPGTVLASLQRGRSALGAKRVLVRVLDGEGRVLVETAEMARELPSAAFPPPIEPGGGLVRGVDVQVGGGSFRVLSAQLQATALGGAEAIVQVALDRQSEQLLLARYRNLLLLVTVPALALSAWLGQLLARRAIAPVRTFAARLASIHADSLDERVAAAGLVAELEPLRGSCNELLARLEDSFERLRRFSSHLAHELRTPIHNLCGEIELALDGSRSAAELAEVLRSAREEAQSLSHIVEGLLFLAYAERPGARIRSQPVDVRDEVASVCEFFEPVAAEAGVALRVEGASGPRFPLDRTLLQRAVSNLLANALAFTPRGGSVTVTVAWRDGLPTVEVADTGCGIEPSRLPDLFDGIYRGAPEQSPGGGRIGLGLGLSIVRSILRLHHGRASIASAPGQGCRVTLEFGRPELGAGGANLAADPTQPEARPGALS
jgi:two-component system heavy metal sensor histidine kinase CusS